MRISTAAFVWTMLCAAPLAYATQAANGNTQSQSAPTPDAPKQDAPTPSPAPAAVTASALLQPSLDTLKQAVGAVKVDKWKGGSVRTEAGTNISSIQRDLQTTLPALLKEADAAPEATSKVLPVSRNVDALYDVVLRVWDGARVAAPGDQVSMLQDALASLDKGRRALNDRLQDMAVAQEKQVSDLHAALKAQPAPVCPVVVTPTCPAAAPAKKKPVKKKPATTPPATAQPNSAQPDGATKPNP